MSAVFVKGQRYLDNQGNEILVVADRKDRSPYPLVGVLDGDPENGDTVRGYTREERFEEYTEDGKFHSWDEPSKRDIAPPPGLRVVVLRLRGKQAHLSEAIYAVRGVRNTADVLAREAELRKLGYEVSVLGYLEDYDA